MKKRIIGILILLCLILTACDKPREEAEKPDSVIPGNGGTNGAKTDSGFYCSLFLGNGFMTEEYALYHNNHSRLQIFDVASKTDLIYCFDPACEHEHSVRDWKTGEVIKKGCIAYDISSKPVMIQGDNLYFLSDENEVWRSDRQGENRKLIAKIPPYIPWGSGEVFFSKDTLFDCYFTDQEMFEVKDENGESQWMIGDFKDKSTCGILRVDLKDGTCKEVFSVEEYNARVSEYDIRGDHLYFTYFYMDCPYVGPNLETNRPDDQIPEGLTVENYWEEMPKHQWICIYDYNISTGELHEVLKDLPAEVVSYCNGFFAVPERSGTTGLYRYDGERIRTLDFKMKKGVRCDSGLVCIGEKEEEYLLIDENTGEVVKRTVVPYDGFLPAVILGNSVYGTMQGEKAYGTGYMSAEDFWKGDITNAVAFSAAD